MVHIYLLPCPLGEFGEGSGALMEAVVYWNYRTISRGEDSLMGRLIYEDHSKCQPCTLLVVADAVCL